VDQRFARDVEGGRAYFSVDQLGSTRALTKGLGEELVAYDYDPYGGSVASSLQIKNAYQFTGRERDDTGLYYYRARYYDPAMGRFISEDPIGMAAGLNTYAYVNGKPLLFTDTSGIFEVYAYGTRGGGVGNEWQYVIEFNPLSPKDLPMWGGKAHQFFDRVGNAVDMTKPSSAGPRDSAGYVECGTLDAKLKKAYRDAGYRDEQRISRQQAMDFLSEAYRGNADMRRMYDSPKATLDSATEKGRSYWYNLLIEQAHPGNSDGVREKMVARRFFGSVHRCPLHSRGATSIDDYSRCCCNHCAQVLSLRNGGWLAGRAYCPEEPCRHGSSLSGAYHADSSLCLEPVRKAA
jgi:RHS repeat-associated protein